MFKKIIIKLIAFLSLGMTLLLIEACDRKSVVRVNENEELKEKAENNLHVLDSLIQTDSANAIWYSMRADLLYRKGKLTDAYQDIMYAVELKGDNIPDLLLLSDIYFALGKSAFARSALRRAEEIDNTDYTVYYALGRHHMLNGNFALAKGNFMKSIELEANPQAYFQLGYMAMLNGDTTEAVSNYQHSIQIDNNYYNSYLQLAIIYMDKDRIYVPEYLRNVLEHKPNSFEALYLFGLFYEQEGKYRETINCYNKAYSIDTTNKYVPFNIAYIYLTELQVFDSAEYWFSRSLEIDSTFEEAKHNYNYTIELQQ